MMKKLVYISILSLLLLSSCRSKRMITVSLPQPVMQADSTQLGDTIGLPARLSPMFTFDQSDLRNVRRQPAKGEVKKQQIKKTAPVQKVIVQRGTRITSKTTHVGSAYKGVSRIKTYDFTHRDVPAAFEGFRIAFVSDLHYKSLLKEEGLKDLVRVLGNNDYEACYDDIVREMRHYGMHLLEHKVDTLRRGGERILVAGVRNPFDLGKNGTSPTLGLSPDDFVILLTHTPDYAEDVPVTNSDLILAGHTHGGQVTLFGLYAPIVPSHYGQRFLSGLKYNSKNIPMIVTNGIGTSQKAIRMFAPAEVVMIVLHRLTD